MGCSMRESTPPREGAMYGKRTESTNLAVPHKSAATCAHAQTNLPTVPSFLVLSKSEMLEVEGGAGGGGGGGGGRGALHLPQS